MLHPERVNRRHFTRDNYSGAFPAVSFLSANYSSIYRCRISSFCVRFPEFFSFPITSPLFSCSSSLFSPVSLCLSNDDFGVRSGTLSTSIQAEGINRFCFELRISFSREPVPQKRRRFPVVAYLLSAPIATSVSNR